MAINTKPVATPPAATQRVLFGQSVSIASLFSASDADGDAIVTYRLWDGGTGGGFFSVNGVQQAARQSIDVSAANLSTAAYVGGSGPGTEDLWAQVFDGTDWSDWITWQEVTLRASNSLPVVNAPGAKNLQPSEWVRLSDFVTVSDADGDAISSFQVRDNGVAAGSAHLWTMATGNVAQGGSVTIAAPGLGDVWIQAGTNLGTDAIEVRVNDGLGWGNWTSFDLVTRQPNRAPVMAPAASVQTVAAGQTVSASGLFSASDADGDAIALYRFWDGGTGGGAIKVGGLAQPGMQNVDLTATQLANTVYAGGATPGSEVLWGQVFDGTAWSAWTNWTMQTLRGANVLPVVNAPATKNLQASEWVKLSDFVTVTDADGDPITQFQLTDNGAGASSARLWTSAGFVAQGGTVTVSASDLSGVWLQGGIAVGTDAISVRANDGVGFGSAASFNAVTRLPNRAPVMTPTAATQSVGIGQTVAASSLFNVSDADGDTITVYRLWDEGAGGGSVKVGGTLQPGRLSIDLSASQLATTVYAGGAGAGSEVLWGQVFDGTAWSNWTSWTMQTLRGSNVLPVVNAPATKNLQASEWVKLSDFVTVTDADGDAITQFQLTDNGSGASSARLWTSAGFVAQGGTVTVSASDLSGVWLQGGTSVGTDAISVRANDGFGFGGAASFNAVTRLPNPLPVVTPTASVQKVAVNQGVAVSTLFSVSDADGDAIQQYRFWDGTAGGGAFRINGNAQPAGQNITVNAADLVSVQYFGGVEGGAERISVQVNDGTGWSNWQTWQQITTLRFTETLGTTGADTINAAASLSQTDKAYFGRQGNDTFNITGGPVVFGGQGNDVYNVAANSVALIYDTGSSGGDVLNMFSLGSDMIRVILDNRHLLLTNSTGSVGAIVVDWQADENRIETFNFGFGSFTYAQMSVLGSSSSGLPQLAGFLTLEQVGYEDGAAIREALDYYRQYDLTLNSHTAPFTNNQFTTVSMFRNDVINVRPQDIFSDGDGPNSLSFMVSHSNTATGHFVLNGNPVANTTAEFSVSAADASHLQYVSDNTAGTDAISMRAFDGLDWSLVTAVQTVNVAASRAPIFNVYPAYPNMQIVSGNSISARGLFRAIDIDAGDSVARYEIQESAANTAGGGYFSVNGVAQAAGHRFAVTPTDLASTFWVAGSPSEAFQESFSVWAFDQHGDQSSIGPLNITTLAATPSDSAGETLPGAAAMTLSPNISSPLYHQDWVGAQDPADFYSFVASGATSFMTKVEEGSVNLAIFDAGGTQRGADIAVTPDSALITVSLLLGSGTYYARITPTAGSQAFYGLAVATNQ